MVKLPKIFSDYIDLFVSLLLSESFWSTDSFSFYLFLFVLLYFFNFSVLHKFFYLSTGIIFIRILSSLDITLSKFSPLTSPQLYSEKSLRSISSSSKMSFNFRTYFFIKLFIYLVIFYFSSADLPILSYNYYL